MPVHKPEDWPRVFEQHLNAGEVEAVLELYEPGARFVTPSGGEVLVGREAIRGPVTGLVRAGAHLESRVVRAVIVDDVALLYTDFRGTSSDAAGRVEIAEQAIEVLRRQPDGTWKLIVGDPRGRGPAVT